MSLLGRGPLGAAEGSERPRPFALAWLTPRIPSSIISLPLYRMCVKRQRRVAHFCLFHSQIQHKAGRTSAVASPPYFERDAYDSGTFGTAFQYGTAQASMLLRTHINYTPEAKGVEIGRRRVNARVKSRAAPDQFYGNTWGFIGATSWRTVGSAKHVTASH
ncbi:hypothetical protein EVAR_56717_1 [Eumeta japonica]|uniref:Uncharacterized protein n=1 Tax=Eumeta variegata TaxID=151549 RepID=A0A4C1Y230_EUMVA|nr:hypothetical protein EVAR_56717_1 [Eumeta japonica]